MFVHFGECLLALFCFVNDFLKSFAVCDEEINQFYKKIRNPINNKIRVLIIAEKSAFLVNKWLKRVRVVKEG